LGISIVAQNLASAEFSKVASDAGAMAAQISSQRISINAENFASPEISRVAEDAARVRSEIEASPLTLSFGPVEAPLIPPVEVPPAEIMFAPIDIPVTPPIEVPPIEVTFAPIEPPILLPIQFPAIEVPSIPPIDVSSFEGAKVTFGEVGVAALEMGENVEASGTGFAQLEKQATSTTVSLTTVARSFTAVTALGSGVISLAGDFGIVDKESAKWARTILAVITVISAMIRLKSYMTVVTTGHTASIAINTTAETANASASIVTSVAHKIKAAATWLAVAAQNALNISHATFLALTGVGIGVIIGAAAAMAYFASQMNAATSGIKDFNAAAAEMPTRSRGIQRAGEESMYRRGVE
jgi:hypothetical protein